MPLPVKTAGLQGRLGMMCWTLDAGDVHAARSARKAAAAALRAYTDSEEALSAAELVVGELLSNAARHAKGHVCLELSRADGRAQISVHDTTPAFALDVRRPLDEYAESGRGLYIISELARRVSVVPLAGMGKRVCVTLDLHVPHGELAASCERPWLRHDAGVCMRPRVTSYHPELIGP